MSIWPLCNYRLPSPSLGLILLKYCFICERCLLQYYSKICFCHFLSSFRSSKWWQDLNPQTWENKVSDAPLYDCRLPSPSLLLNMILFYSINMTSLIFIQISAFLYHFNYQQKCRGLNPQAFVDDMSIWPLCNYRLPSPSLDLIVTKNLFLF